MFLFGVTIWTEKEKLERKSMMTIPSRMKSPLELVLNILRARWKRIHTELDTMSLFRKA